MNRNQSLCFLSSSQLAVLQQSSGEYSLTSAEISIPRRYGNPSPFPIRNPELKVPISGGVVDCHDLIFVELIAAERVKKTADRICGPLVTVRDLRRAGEPNRPVAVELFDNDVGKCLHDRQSTSSPIRDT